ncbi:MAG: ATPase domain-containing protein [Candidatus Anstonellales archaeon]
MKMELIKSGIKGLDKILGGGIPKRSVIAISGPTGCGKSTFGMNFIVGGAEQGEAGLYIPIESTKEDVVEQMNEFSWNISFLEKNKKLFFLDYPPHEVDQFISKMNPIKELIETMGIERVVIDSIMPIALHFNTDLERKRGFMKLIENIKKWNTTTFIITEDTPMTTQDVLPSTKYGIETLVDGWIHIHYIWREERRERMIEILKMKGARHEMRLYPMEITKSGIVVKS